MAKKKATRAAASRGAKKKTAKKKTARPRAVAAAPDPLAGIRSSTQVNFNPLKKQIKAHISRLKAVKEPSEPIQRALRSLEAVDADLSNECLPSMILMTPA